MGGRDLTLTLTLTLTLFLTLEQLWAGEIPRLEAEKRAAKQVVRVRIRVRVRVSGLYDT